MMKKPLIGISANLSYVDMGNRGSSARNYVGTTYVKSVEMAGGVPVILPNLQDAALLERQVEMLDGVILSGGADLDPRLYGEQPIDELGFVNLEVDQFYLDLIHTCEKLGKPVLGICKGCQAVNVAYGGTLYQDLKAQGATKFKHVGDAPGRYPCHMAKISEKSKFLSFLPQQVDVNSFHHQAVKQVADGFTVAATAHDGVIEAIERMEPTPVIGIQWHPEAQGCSVIHTPGHALGYPIYELTALVHRYGIENCIQPVEKRCEEYVQRLLFWEQQEPTLQREWASFLR